MIRLAPSRRTRFGVASLAPVASVLLVAALTACSGDPSTGDTGKAAGDPAPSGAAIGRPADAGDGEQSPKSGQAGFADAPCPGKRAKKLPWERPQVLAWSLLDGCRMVFVGSADQKLFLAGLADDGSVRSLGPIPESRDDAGLVSVAATDDAVWIGGASDAGAVAVHVDRVSGARTTIRLPGQGIASMARAGDDVVALVVDDERSGLYRLTAARTAVEIATVNHPLRHLAVDGDRLVATGADVKRGWVATGRLSAGSVTSTKLGKNLQSRGVALVEGRVVAAFERLDANQVPERTVVYTGAAGKPSSWQASRGRRGDDVSALAVTPSGVLASVSRRGIPAVMRVADDGALRSWKTFRGEQSFVTVLGSTTATWMVGQRFVRTVAGQGT